MTNVVINKGYENKPNTPNKKYFKNNKRFVNNATKQIDDITIRVIPIIFS